jgi:prefoldin beta subunit
MSNQAETAKELNILEHNLQHLLMQRQAIESQLAEINNALSEVSKSNDDVYNVVGSVMLKTSKEKITHDLEARKKMIDIRLSSVDKQEKLIEFKVKELQKEIRASSK